MNGSSSRERILERSQSADRRRARRERAGTRPAEVTGAVEVALQKGLVIDTHVPVSLLGIGLATIECRTVIWSAGFSVPDRDVSAAERAGYRPRKRAGGSAGHKHGRQAR